MEKIKSLLNSYERITNDILEGAVKKWNANVTIKVRVADVLEINNSGISNERYSYALAAHFDFVITNSDYLPLFAVEFDGNYHYTDQDTLRKDIIKDGLVNEFGLPLLRIGANFLQSLGKFNLLSWLIDEWFFYKSFNQAQVEGLMGYDESYLYGSMFTFQDNKLISHDPFYPYRKKLLSLSQPGQELRVEGAFDIFNNFISFSSFKFKEDGFVIGNARCRKFSYPPVELINFAGDLAYCDAVSNYQRYLLCSYSAITYDDFETKREAFFKNSKTILSISRSSFGKMKRA